MNMQSGVDQVSKEQRKHPRRELHVEVELGFPSGEKQIVRTRDVSECGVFIVLDRLRRPVIGEVVTVKTCDDSGEKLESLFPSSDAVVVRQEEGGIGLAFIELDFADDF